jgi:hypothetical protein
LLRFARNDVPPIRVIARSYRALKNARHCEERSDEAIHPIKGGSRARKIALIEAIHPDWRDLYKSLA